MRQDDKSTQRYLWENTWLLSLLMNDQAEAREAISQLLAINDDSLDDWKTVSQFKTLRVHLRQTTKVWKQREKCGSSLKNLERIDGSAK